MLVSPSPKTITAALFLQAGIWVPVLILASFFPEIIMSFTGPGLGQVCFYFLLLLYVVATPYLLFNLKKKIVHGKNIETDPKRITKQIDGIWDAVYSVDPNSNITSWNQGAVNLYGYSSDEAIGQHSNTLLKTDFYDGNLAVAWETIHRTNYWNGELKRVTKSGKTINVRSSSSGVRDASGTVTGYVNVSFDITHERKLNNAISHLAQMVEQSSDAIISCNLDAVIVSWNQSAEKLLGFSRNEVVGKKMADFAIMSFSAAELEGLQKKLQQQETLVIEKKHQHKTGESFIAEVTASALKNIDGAMASMVFTIKDISLRKMWQTGIEESKKELETKVYQRTLELFRNEQRFRSLVERNNEIIALVDAAGKATYRSPSATRITGFSNQDMKTISIYEHVHMDDLDKLMEMVKEAKKTPGTLFNLQYRYQHKKGHWLILEGTILNLLEDESVNGILFNFRDVTTRIEQENKLIINEERHRHALDSMMEGVQIIGHDWCFLYVNDAACTHIRFPKEQLLGSPVTETFAEADNKKVFESIRLCFSERKRIQLEFEYILPDQQSAGWFELSIQPVPEGVFILSNDITPKKNAHLQVQQSAQQMKTIFDNTSDGFVLLDRNGIILAHNDMASKTITANKNALLETGQSIKSFIEPDKKEYLKYVYQKVLSGDTVEYETCYTHTQPLQWVHFSFSPVVMSGETVGICVTSRDISHRKEAEFFMKERMAEKKKLLERLRSIINTLPANIALLDKDGCIIEANQTWKDFYPQCQPGDDYTAQAGELAAGVRCVLSGDCREFSEEYSVVKTDRVSWFRMLVTPLEDGAVAGAVVMHIDISAVRQMEHERMNERMAEQQKIKQAMLQGQEEERNAIGVELHDNVNQVLAGTTLLLSMLKAGDAAVEDIVPTCINQINVAINENRKIAHQFWSPDLKTSKLTEQLESLVYTMLDAAGIDAHLCTSDFDENSLDTEQKTHLYRIAQEQCTNIVKYAKAKNASIILENAGAQVLMTIEDDGVGMDSSQKIKGIGLKNIRGRISIYNGTVDIKTGKGEGFCLEVRMPVHTSPVTAR